jgi:hypothetical protein
MRDSQAGLSVLDGDSDSAASGNAETPEREMYSGAEAEPAGAAANAQSVPLPERDVVPLHACTRERANPIQRL